MKKVLIITYYWPPAGGPGVQRVLKFAKYLPEFGWQPVILTVANGDYPAVDESLSAEIPADLKVYKTKTLGPFHSYRKMTGKNTTEQIPTYVLNPELTETRRTRLAKWIRANFFLPDARLGWIPFARKRGREIIEAENIAVILASSPPHSLQFTARALARQAGLKWVADLRDPWTEAFWQRELHATRPARFINRRMEKSILNSANALVTVSASLAELFHEKTGKDCAVIPNGFDAGDFKDIKKTNNPKFTITYSGSLGKDQPVGALLRALNGLEPEILRQIQVYFYGSVHSRQMAEIHAVGLTDMIAVLPYLPHRELIARIVNSEILLLVIPDTPDNRGILTGKVFEYLATGNFILGIGPADCDAARLIAETDAGQMCPYTAGLSEIIREQFLKWRAGIETGKKHPAIERYSRRNLTGELAQVLEKQVV